MLKIIPIALLLASASQASEYKQFYLSGGKQVETAQAITDAMSGKPVMKCQSVEAKPSKSGTSIGLKNVKRPKEGAK